MNEDEHKKQLEKLSSNVDKLITIYNSLLERNAQLTQEVKNLNRELNIKKDKLIELESKYNNLMLAQAFGSHDSGNRESKQKINKIIREIDNCIALLNK